MQDVTITQYINYQSTMRLKEYNIDDSENILFAVNVDIGAWNEMVNELVEKLPAELRPCSNWDILSYLRHHIKGVSLPQLYLKASSKKK